MEDSSRPPLGEIRVIIGGSTTGQSSKSKKAYLKVVQSVQLSGRSPIARSTDERAITFTDEDADRIHHPYDDALVISLLIANYTTRRVLVDNGSSADILYYPAFQQMRLGRDQLRPVNSPLVGFGGMKVQPVGTISLSVVVGAYPRQITKDVNFLVVDCPSSYNAIIGRPTLNSWKTVTSTYHLSVKFPTEHGVGQVQGDQLAARECYLAMLAMDEQVQAMNIEEKRNVGATYQRLVNHMFRPQIGRNVEVYVDDMLVKSQDEGRHLDDLQETFETLRRYHMKLNPSKCAFGVSSGKFLGFMVSHRGIEANPDKIQAILDMKPPQNTKEIQSLTGRVAALNRAPLLSPSVEGEELYLYLAVTPYAVSSALIREEDKVQRPVYYTSKALKGAEGRYPQMEKLAFALITASRKLRYQPRHAIKAQALADFIAEFTPSHNEAEDSKRWIVHVDGSSTRHAGGIGVVLQSPEGDKLKHKVRLQYQATNNEVEYEALLKGLELAKSVEAKSICVMGDSQLIMGQVNGMYEAKEGRMKKYLGRVMRLVKRFEKADFVQIPREENVEADTIAKEASADESLEKSDEVQYMPSIDAQEVQQVDNRENWMTPIISYLKDGRLPEEKDEARKVRVRSARYVLMNEVLYKRGFSQPYLRCLAPDETNYVLREVHEGACGNHSGARSLVHKVVRAGYYWPNMQADAKAYVKICDQCQRFSNVPRQPSEYLTPMVAPWPFAQWGLDILGPFPLGVRQMKTTVRTPTGETPFKLAYGSDALIPAEVHMANHRVMTYQDRDNEDQLRLNLDLIDEVRANAEYRAANLKL
ncbi:uncharacterized protein LOC126703759 [Quercus robur]|uniref:uncharacterized protein LOC126703759 n=1 Tax=Quercus robur TaxID=38942 RepID=UPI0021622285|nr:uncharacterized protein LOC126703759 [Quercus robur]